MKKEKQITQEVLDALPDAPDELADIVAAVMIDFGPDGHIDGHEEIAKAAYAWCNGVKL